MEAILTFDVGTTAIKTCLFDRALKCLAIRTDEYDLHTHDDRVELPAEIYWQTMCRAVAEIGKKLPLSQVRAICLTTQITGEALQATLGGMLESIGQQGGSLEEAAETVGAIDYSALTCDARIYLDKETYLPMAEEMTFSGMSDVLNPLYEQMGMKADVTSCTASTTFLSYEVQEETVLPRGGKGEG